MDLSTALIISLFFYAIFLILIGIEYFTSRKEERADEKEHLAAPSQAGKPKEEEKKHPLEDLEKEREEETEPPVEVPVAAPGEEAKSPAETVGAPRVWEEEEFE